MDEARAVSRFLALAAMLSLLAGCAAVAITFEQTAPDSDAIHAAPISGERPQAIVLNVREDSAKAPYEASASSPEFRQALVGALEGTQLFSKVVDTDLVSANLQDAVKLSARINSKVDRHEGKNNANALVFALTVTLAGPFLREEYTYTGDLTIEALDVRGETKRYTASSSATADYNVFTDNLLDVSKKVMAEVHQRNLTAIANQMLKEREFFALKSAPAGGAKKPATVLASDVDRVPAGTIATSKRRHAVVIGIDEYRQKLPTADFARRDAEIVSEYLAKVMGYPEENIAVLVGDHAGRADLEKYLERWLPNRVEPGDSVFVYFSGHGAPNTKTGDAYLVPYDGDPAYIDSTGYPLKRLYDQLAKLPAGEVVVMLDSCFSGAGGRSVVAKGMRPMMLSMDAAIGVSAKTIVLAASSGDQVSSTYETKGHGLFTYFFLKGLQGEADKNGDGRIEIGELYDYVKPQVERVARREYNNEQTPQLLGSRELLTKGVRLVDRPKP
jgi:hypothetical protein